MAQMPVMKKLEAMGLKPTLRMAKAKAVSDDVSLLYVPFYF